METLKVESISTTTTAQVQFNATGGYIINGSYDRRSDGAFNRISITVISGDGKVTGNYNEHSGYLSGLSLNTLNATPEQVEQMQNLVKKAIELIKTNETI